MHKIAVDTFSFIDTYSSGQVLNFIGDFYAKERSYELEAITAHAIFEAKYVQKAQNKGTLYYRALPETPSNKKALVSLLGLDMPIKAFYAFAESTHDKVLEKAINQFYGMRVGKAEPWETAVCFVISQFNNIKRIKNSIKCMIENLGRRLYGKRLFPLPEDILESKHRLEACRLGFRSKYVLELAKAFNERDMLGLYKESYEEAKKELMAIKGIGDKVADCILLFGYGKTEAFPIDVWIKRVVEMAYFNGKRLTLRQIHDFAEKRFGVYAGYAQQYLFQYARINKIR